MKEGIILSETNESQLKAVRKYNSQCKSVSIRYTPKELSEFERFERYISENNVNKAEYIKNLIKADLNKKGYWLQSVWNIRLTNGQFRMTNGHIFVTNGQFRKLGMITIIDFMEMCGLVLVNFLFSIGICGKCG